MLLCKKVPKWIHMQMRYTRYDEIIPENRRSPSLCKQEELATEAKKYPSFPVDVWCEVYSLHPTSPIVQWDRTERQLSLDCSTWLVSRDQCVSHLRYVKSSRCQGLLPPYMHRLQGSFICMTMCIVLGSNIAQLKPSQAETLCWGWFKPKVKTIKDSPN